MGNSSSSHGATQRRHEESMQQQRLQHEARMQQERLEHQRKIKELNLKEKNEAIKRLKGDIKRYEDKNCNIESHLTSGQAIYYRLESELNNKEIEIKVLNENSNKKLNEVSAKIDTAQRKFNEADIQIRNAIDSTNVDEGNIPQFLTLVNDGLLFATMRGQQEQDKMSAKLGVFCELIERTCNAKLKISTYFKSKSLERFSPILAEKGYYNMEHIKCDDNDEWNDLKQLITKQITEKKEESMLEREEKALKKICTKPTTTWIPDEKDKEEIVRKELLKTAPKFSLFFGAMHEAVTQVDNLLVYNVKLNDMQRKAIASAPSIDYDQDNKNDDDEKEKEEKEEIQDVFERNQRKILGKGSECFVKYESSNEWFLGVIKDIVYNAKGEWLTVEYELNESELKSIETKRFSKNIKSIGQRKEWVKGSKCEIYSNTNSKWYKGTIFEVKNDKEGEWMVVEYFINNGKDRKITEIGRFSTDIRSDRNINNNSMECKVVENMKFEHKELNQKKKECESLQIVAVTKLHVTDALKQDFHIDTKEMEQLKKMENELEPKKKDLNTKHDQLEAIQDALTEIEAEMEIIEEDEENEDFDADIDDDDDDDNKEDENEKRKKELKTKKKKLRVKQKKLNSIIKRVEQKVEKQIVAFQERKNEIKSMRGVLKKSFTVITNVQDSCLQIIKSQCLIRQSVLLAKQILEYKPAKPSEEAEPLWNVITNGIGDIFENAITLNKVSQTYWGFFIKFQHSFDSFVSANNMKTNVSLLVAAEGLITDIVAIQKFQTQLDEKMDELRKSAITTIRECVNKTAGATNFQSAMSKRKQAEQDLRSKNKEYDLLKLQEDAKFAQLFAGSEKLKSEMKSLQYKKDAFDTEKKLNRQWIDQLKQQLTNIEKRQVT